jgi:hypothetical protein
MKRYLLVLLAFATLSSCAVSQESETSNQKPTPRHMSDVKHGMTKDTVLNGLSKNYRVRTEAEGDIWFMSPGQGEPSDGGGVIRFKAGVVDFVVEELLPRYGDDAAALVRVIFQLLWSHAEKGPPDPILTRRILSAEVELTDGHPLMEDQIIKIKVSDGSQLNISMSRRKGAANSTVTIERVW